MKKVVVISLGGSQIIKDGKINLKFLREFKKIILKNSTRYRFVVVCGGGSVARMYIQGLENEMLQSFIGISVTRTNARFMSYFFGSKNFDGVPSKMKDVLNRLKKEKVVFCGGLEYHPNQTSDSTAAQIASELKCDFINLTNVDGLFSSNPLKNKNAKFISNISWKEFYGVSKKIAFKPGQHFVLDQKAAKIILDNKIKTYVLGNNLNNLGVVLGGKRFKGTLIFG